MTLQEALEVLDHRQPQGSTPFEIALRTVHQKARNLLALGVPPETETTPLVTRAVTRWREQ